ncbi:hypothetical protein Hanom_Chr05g00446751 [Helianthus anomalus]
MEIRLRVHLNVEDPFIILNPEHNQVFSSSPKILSFLLDPSSFFSIIYDEDGYKIISKQGSQLDSPPKSQNPLNSPLSELCRFTNPEVDQFYTPPFQIGYSYPFPQIHSALLHVDFYVLQSGHANVWRVLYTFERIIKDEGLSFNLSKLACLYNLVSHGSHRFLFKAKPQHPLPLLKTTKNDTSWRNQFFFVWRDTIPLGNTLPKKWVWKGAQKSASKSASKFDVGDINSIIYPCSLKKELAKGKSQPEPKTMSTRARTAPIGRSLLIAPMMPSKGLSVSKPSMTEALWYLRKIHCHLNLLFHFFETAYQISGRNFFQLGDDVTTCNFRLLP